MVKRILLPLLQFIAFLVLMFVGGNWDFIRLGQEIHAMQTHTTFFNPIPTIKTPLGSHILIANGLIFASVLLLLILLFEILRKKLKPWASLTALAYVLAVVLAFAAKMGLPPAN
jgi:phosphoglycerol transferase MdoB-like AlkP superfamily enzyme